MLLRVCIACIVAIVPFAVESEELTFTFIGNESFHITDGETTLLTDFPYASGYMGYMSYAMDDVPKITDGVSLITHFHADHWSRRIFETMDTRIIAPPAIVKRIEAERVIPLDENLRAEYKGISVQAIPMEHMLAPQHYSYLVTWHGLRLYFPGDTETPADMLQQKDIDVMFITPWLIRTIARQELVLDCKKLVVYHQKVGEEFPDFQGVLRMEQNAQFTVATDDD